MDSSVDGTGGNGWLPCLVFLTLRIESNAWGELKRGWNVLEDNCGGFDMGGARYVYEGK